MLYSFISLVTGAAGVEELADPGPAAGSGEGAEESRRDGAGSGDSPQGSRYLARGGRSAHVTTAATSHPQVCGVLVLLHHHQDQQLSADRGPELLFVSVFIIFTTNCTVYNVRDVFDNTYRLANPDLTGPYFVRTSGSPD